MADFDVLIIGAGQAGIPLARFCREKGRTVALAEREHLGGSCVNFGCTPTKAVIASAAAAHACRRSKELGIGCGPVSVDFHAVLDRARHLVARSRSSLSKGLADAGVEVLRGHARLAGKRGDRLVVSIGDRTVTAKDVVLDTGTRSTLPEVEGLGDVPFLHAGNWLEAERLPRRMAILGAGVIGIEMSQAYTRLGSAVTLLDPGSQILRREDRDVSDALQAMLEKEGVRFQLGSKLQRVRKRDGELSLTIERDGRTVELTTDALFVATGRTPNTDQLGLDTVGVRTDENGFVVVEPSLATSVPGVWAVGDIRGGPMFTHTSWDDHRILECQLFGNTSRTTDRVVPYAVFTEPELGRVGLTEAEARKLGRALDIKRFDFSANGRAIQEGRDQGFVKLVVDREQDRLLGAAVLGPAGGELVQLCTLAMNAKLSISAIKDPMFIHPTLCEAVQSAAMIKGSTEG